LHYQILLALINGVPGHPHFGSNNYIRRLIERFRSPDANERSALAQLVLAIRSARPSAGAAILQMVLVCLSDYLEGLLSPYVVAPALEVVQRYSEEKPDAVLYLRHILPLLGSLHYISFHEAMQQIVRYFVFKLPQTAAPTMKAIIAKFPLTHSAKAVEFLRLLTAVLPRVPERVLHAEVKTIFMLYTRCFGLEQVKVAQAACSVFDTLELEKLLSGHARTLYSAIYPVLLQASKDSWSPNIVTCVDDVFKTLGRLNTTAFQEVVRQPGGKITRSEELPNWAGIARRASRVDTQFNLAEKLVEIQRVFAMPAPMPAPMTLQTTKPMGLGGSIARSGSPGLT
jgi:hypothetical protein